MNGFEFKSFLYGLSAMVISAVMVGVFSLIKKMCILYLNKANKH